MKWAILTPIIGVCYLILQIHKRNLAGWQHYACLTSLVFLISILFLVESGEVQSFDVAGNSVKLVDKKLEEVRVLTEQNKLLARLSVEMIEKVTSGLIADSSYNENAAHQSEVNLLKSAGFSDTDIQKVFDDARQGGTRTNSP
jgi:hypothetical protein